ncbi:hypothetical protein AQUCO_00600435v1 [Aquilegia coerulea]|uniref:Uncharacterized protein n=1 Tax=Aquilegia coerulea TaxID=218851 RepID=A0A2G5EPT8_AQUCA|nr:hypothetical protein AQUCO_00600435v1 [Aquilegia coerulea]
MGKSGEEEEEEEQEGLSVHSPCQAPPSSASSLPKEQSQIDLELKLLEALEIYPPNKLQVSTDTFLLMRSCNCWIASITWKC